MEQARQKALNGAQWIDVRYPSEYQYDRLPGARNIPLSEIRNAFGALDMDEEYIVYCQSGNRAAQSAAVLADLGYKNVKVYDSSWLGYSSCLTAPAEDEVWTNFGSLPATIKGLENRFGEIERVAAKTR